MEILGATGNNLKNINLKIPLGTFTCVTGVSGSGKSTLLLHTLYNALNLMLNNNKSRKLPKPFKNYKGVELIDKIIDIDQSPIGRTPRSNPATYTGAFGPIRDWFANLPESKARGYKVGRFSFNVKGGRCESCEGDGVITYEMHFLPDVYIACDVCKGSRYNRETLEIKYKNKNRKSLGPLKKKEFFDKLTNLMTNLAHQIVKDGEGASKFIKISIDGAQNYKDAKSLGMSIANYLLFKTAMAELTKSKRQSSAVQLARVGRILEIATDNEMKKIEKNFTFLATVGSTAPFIGLFGTVWGIMNSFQSIAISRNTSLAIVAPGIAEALFATALGLLAAIPAVVAYNKFNSDTQRYFSKIENFSKRFLSII